MVSSDDMFERVVRASRLNELIAPFTVRRLFIKADVNPQRGVDEAAVRKALPAFEQGLATFLSDEDLEAALAELRALASV